MHICTITEKAFRGYSMILVNIVAKSLIRTQFCQNKDKTVGQQRSSEGQYPSRPLPRPISPSVSPLILAAPDATSRICSTL